MRFLSLVCVVLASTVAVDAFVPAAVVQKAKSSASMSMAQKSVDDSDDIMQMWGKAAMASVVSWGVAAQLASAVMLPASPTSIQDTSIMSSQPTTLISAKAKEGTMNSNMPSYGDTYKGDVKSSKFAPPSLNPFSDSDSKASDSTSQADDIAKQAADKANSDAKEAADKGTSS